MSAILAALALNRTVAHYPTFNAPRSIRRTCAFSVTTFILRSGILCSRNQSRNATAELYVVRQMFQEGGPAGLYSSGWSVNHVISSPQRSEQGDRPDYVACGTQFWNQNVHRLRSDKCEKDQRPPGFQCRTSSFRWGLSTEYRILSHILATEDLHWL